MSDSEIQRSIRRGVALLLIPLSSNGLPEFVAWTLPGVSSAFGAVAFVGAVLYLVVSVTRQVHAAADTPF
ncbi:hypothetical protein [Halopelagius fulvigenes]|uniref:Uncharacterized protein n=1 Tax=Halopelagius fulvigenes TaxID=1198324 RepID=A0ABD5U1L3_9EURY